MLDVWLLAAAHAASPDQPPMASVTPLAVPERAAVVVGANRAPAGRDLLRFAHADAQQVARVLVDVAGFSTDAVHVLLDPEPEVVLQALRAAKADQTVLFYYSGHADGQALFPNGEALPIADVRDALAALPADLRVGVVDACRGGSWTGTKGPFVVPDANRPRVLLEPEVVTPVSQGIALLSASSGIEAAHESSTVGGSYFTRHWVTGLRGPADGDGDGLIRLDESFAYARAATIRDSALQVGITQHPSFRLDVRGRETAVLVDLRGAPGTLIVPPGLGEVAVFTADGGTHVVTIPEPPEAVTVALPPGPYLLRRERDGRGEGADVDVGVDERVVLDDDDFEPEEAWALAPKGVTERHTEVLVPRKAQVVASALVDTPLSSADGLGARPELSLELGLTRHLSISVIGPTALTLRFANPDESLEVALQAGIWDVRGCCEDSTVLDAGVGAFVRGNFSTHTRWTFAAQRRNRFLGQTGPVHTEVAIGAEIPIRDRITLYPAFLLFFGLATPDSTEPGMLQCALGGGMPWGPRRLPLVRIHLSDGVGLDGHFRAPPIPRRPSGNSSADEPLYAFAVGVGITVASRGVLRPARRATD